MPRTEVLVGGAELDSAAILEIGTGVGGALDGAAVTVTVITEIGRAVVTAAATWKYLEGNPWDRYIKERKAMNSSEHLKIDTITRPKARNKFWEEISKARTLPAQAFCTPRPKMTHMRRTCWWRTHVMHTST